MKKNYFDTLMESLEDAAAFAQGDASRARVVELDAPGPAYGAKDVARTRSDLNLIQWLVAK